MSEKNKPAHTIRRPGGLKLAIWKNDGEHGLFYTATATRSYKDGDQWKETTSFHHQDLLPLAKMFDEAETWIAQELAKVKAAEQGYSEREEQKRAGHGGR
jgi:hypothetical protein